MLKLLRPQDEFYKHCLTGAPLTTRMGRSGSCLKPVRLKTGIWRRQKLRNRLQGKLRLPEGWGAQSPLLQPSPTVRVP
jgi:hypothetical protein